MNKKGNLFSILQNPDELANALYFPKKPFPTEFRRQVQILIEEGYLEFTPLLTVLCNLLGEKYENIYSLKSKSELHRNDSGEKHKQDICRPHHDDQLPISRHASSESTDLEFRNAELYEPAKERFNSSLNSTCNTKYVDPELSELSNLISMLGIQGKDRPVYLAKRLLFDSTINTKTLFKDMKALQSKVKEAKLASI